MVPFFAVIVIDKSFQTHCLTSLNKNFLFNVFRRTVFGEFSANAARGADFTLVSQAQPWNYRNSGATVASPETIKRWSCVICRANETQIRPSGCVLFFSNFFSHTYPTVSNV